MDCCSNHVVHYQGRRLARIFTIGSHWMTAYGLVYCCAKVVLLAAESESFQFADRPARISLCQPFEGHTERPCSWQLTDQSLRRFLNGHCLIQKLSCATQDHRRLCNLLLSDSTTRVILLMHGPWYSVKTRVKSSP